MKIFALAATALFGTTAHATSAPVEVRNSGIVCTFFAGATSFTQVFPSDGSVEPITRFLSVSEIQCPGGACTFKGVDGSLTIVVDGTNTSVGPPELLVSGSCHSL